MGKMFREMFIIFVSWSFFSLSGYANAQTQEVSAFAYGAIVSVSKKEIVVREYDYEKDEEVDNIYAINDKTEINGVKTIAEIILGDNVDVVYTIVNDQKVAQSLSVEKPTDEEDESLEVQGSTINAQGFIPASAPK